MGSTEESSIMGLTSHIRLSGQFIEDDTLPLDGSVPDPKLFTDKMIAAGTYI